jgi:hypothetical protein
MKSIGILLFILFLVYCIIYYKSRKFNNKEQVIEYRNLPYSVLEQISNDDIENTINNFESDIYSKI